LSRRVKDLIISFSLSNLCFLSAWLVLLNPYHHVYYFWKENPGLVEVESLTFAILCLAAVFWLSSLVVRRFKNRRLYRLAQLGFLLCLGWPINSFLTDYLQVPPGDLFRKGLLQVAIAVLIAIVVVLVLLRYSKQATRIALHLVLILSPLYFVNLVSVIYLQRQYASSPVATGYTRELAVPAPASTRVVWIIFDELEQNLPFDKRPPELSLPEFDRFQQQAIVATSAFPPSEKTLTALPSLVTGQLVQQASAINSNDLRLVLSDGRDSSWSELSNVFRQAGDEGFTSGLAGWYHPYCRVLQKDLNWCFWAPQLGGTNPSPGKLTFRESLSKSILRAAYRLPFVFRIFRSRYDARQRWNREEELFEISRAADDLLRRKFSLTLLHFPIPHPPWIYDARTKQFASHLTSYLDNVALADKQLGDVRRTLEDMGEWNRTVVLVSGDHWWRRDPPDANGRLDHRVPFMLKLAGQNRTEEYRTPFNTILTRELVIQLLRDDLKNPKEVEDWLNRNSRYAESPLTINAP
jgi:hypothetical protein